MLADERMHGEVVRGLAARGRARMSSTLRAAVFGANDGLVGNVALVLGVIGGAGSRTVLLTGLSGLLAGALSMAVGEFISVGQPAIARRRDRRQHDRRSGSRASPRCWWRRAHQARADAHRGNRRHAVRRATAAPRAVPARHRGATAAACSPPVYGRAA